MKLYQYQNCDSCRKAKKFLDANGIDYQPIPIREQPPSLDELEQMLGAYQGELRKLFNTSGMDYRKGNYKERLKEMSQQQALEALAANGNLIKRPFLIGDGVALVGFKPELWQPALGIDP